MSVINFEKRQKPLVRTEAILPKTDVELRKLFDAVQGGAILAIETRDIGADLAIIEGTQHPTIAQNDNIAVVMVDLSESDNMADEFKAQVRATAKGQTTAVSMGGAGHQVHLRRCRKSGPVAAVA